MSDPDNGKQDERGFIRETIHEPQAKASAGKRIAAVLGLGLLFGAAGGAGFTAAGYWMRKALHITDIRESVVIPRDPVTAVDSSEAPQTPVQEELSSGEEENPDGKGDNSGPEEDEPSFVSFGKRVFSVLEYSLATVTARRDQEDLFGGIYTHNQDSFGVIIAITKEDIRILTESALLENAEKVHVSLHGGYGGEADLLGMDRTSGFAVVSLPLTELPEGAAEELAPAELGNSYLTLMGDMAVVVGRPVGHLTSMASGIISYIEEDVQDTDFNYQILHTDISGSEDAGGLLADEQGRIIGWIGSSGVEAESSLITAYSISDLKSLIEGLSNGETACKLGVHVQEVTQEMAESRDLPPGLFVTDVIPGMPALAAGIQSGDILMRIGDSEIRTVQDLQAVLVDAEPGDETTVTVSRRGRDGYGEETFAVVLEPR